MRNPTILILLLVGFGAVSHPPAQPTTEEGAGLSEVIVPLEVPSAFLDGARRVVAEELADLPVKSAGAPRKTRSKSGECVLWGDLFRTGECFALAELDNSPDAEGSDLSGFAFAQWKKDRWELRGLWKISSNWRPEGWKPSDGDYLPITPATYPFTLHDLNGDGVPEVVVAGEVWRYWQENYLFRFDPHRKALDLQAMAMREPVKAGLYVRLYFNSGHRSIFEEWEFLRWQGDKLVSVASWHEESPYNNIDPMFSEAVLTRADGSEAITRVSETDWPDPEKVDI